MDIKPDPWETHVPPDLIPAIAHLRESFERVNLDFGLTTQAVCFSQLHGGQGKAGKNPGEYADVMAEIRKIVGPGACRRFDSLIRQSSLPAILRAFLDLYIEGLKIQALYIFQELLEIGRANEGRLGTGSIEWAKSQAFLLIHSRRHSLKNWVKEVCHEQIWDQSEIMADQIYWPKWQAPFFLLMKPCLYKPYKPDLVWVLQDSGTSQKVLEEFADQYARTLEEEIKSHAGRLAVRLAKQQNEMHGTSRDHESQRGQHSQEGRRPTVARKTKPLSKKNSNKRLVIKDALRAKLKGRQYCKLLDDRMVNVPSPWVDEGCPNGYQRAYQIPRWRKRIQDEKCRIKRQIQKV